MRSFPIPSPQVADDHTEIGQVDLLQWLNALWRGKWHILFWVLVALVLGGYYAFRVKTPLYTATTTIALQNRAEKVVDLASPISALGGDYYTINTEVAVLTSRELASKLVDKLDLMSDPLFNYTLAPPVEEGFSLGTVIGGLRSLFEGGGDEEILAPPTPEEIREEVVAAARGSISASNEFSSYVFVITATTPDPEASQRLANGLAEVYIEEQIDIKYEATDQATKWLNVRVAELEGKLETAENAVKTFSAKTDLVGPEGLEALNRQLKDRRDRVLDAKVNTDALTARVAALETALATGEPARMAAAADDTALSQTLSRLNVEGARQAFDARFERLLERTRFEALQTEAKTAALERSVAELEAQVQRQSAELLELQQLEREAAANRQIYEYFLNRLKEISVQQGIHRADSRMLSRAVLPRSPSSPRKGLILFLSAALGLMLGVALVLIREMRQTGIRSARELEQATGITILAQVPKAPVNKRRRVLRYLIGKPSSALVEAVRNLRTSVMLSNMDAPPQVIVVTSSQPGEGKTTQSIALAQSFAGLGKRVLLIEGDIRRRTFREYFASGKQPGLVTAVSGQSPIDDCLIYHDGLGIDVLTGERTSMNAADFFSSNRFEAFLSERRAEYDVIIIDTPPVLVTTDARIIGRLADALIYAVHWDRTSLTQVREGLRLLETAGVKVSGLVLSQIDPRKVRRYGGDYSKLYYGYGGKYYSN